MTAGRWKIFYADGSTFSEQDGEPRDAPKRGVLIVHTEDGRHNRRVLKMTDYYAWSPSIGRWIELQDAAAVINRALLEDITAVAGQYVREADFEKAMIAADNDDYVPRISPAEPSPAVWQKG